MPMKVTFFFRQAQTGWTESYYNNSNSHPGVLALARNLAKFRMVLCGAPVELPYIRVSDIEIRGDVALDNDKGFSTRQPNQGPLGNFIRVNPAVATSADMSWTAVLVTLDFHQVSRGRIFMRGTPDQFFEGPTGFTPNKLWKDAFLDFDNEHWAPQNQWGLIRKDQSTPANTFKVASATAQLGTNLALTIKGGFAAAAGAKVILRNLKSNLGTLTGTFEVISWAAPVLTIAKTFPIVVPQFYNNSGTVQVLVTSFLQDIHMGYRHATTRHVGGPFGAPVGRRKRPPSMQQV